MNTPDTIIPVAIDTAKPLYDSDGYQHQLVAASRHEIVTKIRGIYCLWDAKTGECLKSGFDDMKLGNTPLSPAELAKRKDEGARLLAILQRTAQASQKLMFGTSSANVRCRPPK